MRIDKFLWCTRYFKTRNMGSEACKKGQVRINNQIVKPSREVFPTDEVQVRINQIGYKFKVLDLPPSRVSAKLVDIYRKDETPQEALDQSKIINLAQDYYRKKGEGRPTKKDRRELDYYREGTDERHLW